MVGVAQLAERRSAPTLWSESRSPLGRRDGNSIDFMNGFVYILVDDNNKYYIGSTSNIHKRFKRHLSGFVYTTHRMKNPKLALCQEFETIEMARKIELRLKKLKRKDYIEKILKDGVINMKI